MVGRGLLGLVAVIAGLALAGAALAEAGRAEAGPLAKTARHRVTARPSQPAGTHNFQVQQLSKDEREAFFQARAAQLAAHPPQAVAALPQQRIGGRGP